MQQYLRTKVTLQSFTAHELTVHMMADTLGKEEVQSQTRFRVPPVALLVEEHLQALWDLRKSQMVITQVASQ